MSSRSILIAAVSVLAAGLARQAYAAPTNQGPPAGAIFDLAGQPLSTGFVNYTTTFKATSATTNVTFALRDDPHYIRLDDITLTTLGGAGNLLVNGDFEAGPPSAAAPAGWTYLNIYGAQFGGSTSPSGARGGQYGYYDGAVQAYDAITQSIATTVGATYSLDFWVAENSGNTDVYRRVSENGDTTGVGGDGIDLLVYAGAGIPAPGGVPEPASWALMLVGFAGLGSMIRARGRLAASV